MVNIAKQKILLWFTCYKASFKYENLNLKSQKYSAKVLPRNLYLSEWLHNSGVSLIKRPSQLSFTIAIASEAFLLEKKPNSFENIHKLIDNFPRQLHGVLTITWTQMLTHIACNKSMDYVGNLTISANRCITLKKITYSLLYPKHPFK